MIVVRRAGRSFGGNAHIELIPSPCKGALESLVANVEAELHIASPYITGAGVELILKRVKTSGNRSSWHLSQKGEGCFSVPEEADEVLLRARVKEGVTGIFSRTILFLLRGGPMKTVDIHPQSGSATSDGYTLSSTMTTWQAITTMSLRPSGLQMRCMKGMAESSLPSRSGLSLAIWWWRTESSLRPTD